MGNITVGEIALIEAGISILARTNATSVKIDNILRDGERAVTVSLTTNPGGSWIEGAYHVEVG